LSEDALRIERIPTSGVPLLSEREWLSAIEPSHGFLGRRELVRSATEWRELEFDLARIEQGSLNRYVVVVPTSDEDAPWKRDLSKRLVDILALPQNWDSYGAPQLTFQAFYAALNTLDALMTPRRLIPDIVPTSRGGVQIEWHDKGIDLEVEIEPEGSVIAYLEDPQRPEALEGHLQDMNDAVSAALDHLIVLDSGQPAT
jgi:hypothetical protein